MGSDSMEDSFHEVETTHSEYFADVSYFHNSNFSDRVLMIEIIPDRPDEIDSTLGMDLTRLGYKIVTISSQVLASNLDFFGKWFSNDMMTVLMSNCHRSVNLRMHASEAAALMNNLHDLNCNTLEPNRRPLLVRWIAPLFGKAKLNVDGASKGNPPRVAGCGWVLRCHCAFIFAFSRCLDSGTSSVNAELLALKHGLMLCKDMNIHKVVVETDSLLVVNWLNNETQPPLQYRELLEGILKLRNDMMFCKVSHVYREANSLADGLANYGARGNNASFSCPSQLPKHLLAIYALDSAGVPTFRSIPASV
ncbi:hypothetical protein F2P56_007124 [Juglans regia]|uniref:Uncharacterized protein LOC109020418 n=2 Tax=Juglans regia TaxID=51240 RepID=A0A2I4HQI7_JUGRE|nr:uncharacterized protein LOC109020418 [Juglans regia]KAF5475310.1 hypothetical protein F2P56_007124 [Juglans regia]